MEWISVCRFNVSPDTRMGGYISEYKRTFFFNWMNQMRLCTDFKNKLSTLLPKWVQRRKWPTSSLNYLVPYIFFILQYICAGVFWAPKKRKKSDERIQIWKSNLNCKHIFNHFWNRIYENREVCYVCMNQLI